MHVRVHVHGLHGTGSIIVVHVTSYMYSVHAHAHVLVTCTCTCSSPEGMDAVDDTRHVLPVVQVGGDGVENLKKKNSKKSSSTKIYNHFLISKVKGGM